MGRLGQVHGNSLSALMALFRRQYYRGVDPVIDHDRGTQPGVSGHSSYKPLMPKVIWMEPVDKSEVLDIEVPKGELPQ